MIRTDDARWTMTHALRTRLLTAIDAEPWGVEERTELRQLVAMHYAGDALSFELVEAIEYFGLNTSRA